MSRKLPKRLAPILFGLLLSGMMSFIVSGLSTFRSIGLVDGFFFTWITAWLGSWVVAFPVVLFVAPMVGRIVAKVSEK